MQVSDLILYTQTNRSSIEINNNGGIIFEIAGPVTCIYRFQTYNAKKVSPEKSREYLMRHVVAQLT